jgi:bifunctional non-homologous end joining protein LigD
MTPPWVAPMLATLSTHQPIGDDWAWELKWDGVRAMALISHDRVLFSNRNGGDITAGYPELAHSGLRAGSPRLLVDGEIVAIDPATGRPSFQLLQSRMHVRDESRVQELSATAPVQFIAFDLVYQNDNALTDLSYIERRKRLLDVDFGATAGWQIPPHEIGDGASTWAIVEQFALEGTVAKRVGSRYQIGRRSTDWVKVKRTLTQPFVVGGWQAGTGRRSGTIGSLVVGVYDDAGNLVPSGSVGSGLRDEDLAHLLAAFGRIATDSSPFAAATPRDTRYIQPIVVIDVKFTEWTDARTLRHPVFLGVRSDIDPATVRHV